MWCQCSVHPSCWAVPFSWSLTVGLGSDVGVGDVTCGVDGCGYVMLLCTPRLWSSQSPVGGVVQPLTVYYSGSCRSVMKRLVQ